MAKIAKISFWNTDLIKSSIDGHIEIVVESKRGKLIESFFVKVPDQFEQLAEKEVHDPNTKFSLAYFGKGRNIKLAVKGESADEAGQRWKDFITHSLTQSTKTEKVILYLVKFSSRKKYSGIPERYSFSVDYTPQASIEFDFRICEKKTLGSSVNYIDLNDVEERGRENSIANHNQVNEDIKQGGWIEIPYSKEAEEFLSSIYSGMETLMGKMEKFLGTSKAAIKSAEGKHPLLLGK